MEIKEWSINMGLYPLNKPTLTVDQITQAVANSKNLSAEELLNIISQATAYNIYLKTIKGTILAQITAAETAYKRRMYLETQRVENKFLKIEEKEAQVIASISEVAELERQLLLLRMKYSKLKDIPLSIDNAIDNMKMVYTRKINEINKS